MLTGIALSVIIMLIIFSLVLQASPIGVITQIGIDNTAIIDGVPTTFIVEATDVIFSIDTSSLIVSALFILATIIIVALGTGIQVLASGLSPATVRIFILITGYVGIWTALSVLVFSLIVSIEIFGSVIYITLTIAYVTGVVQKISEG